MKFFWIGGISKVEVGWYEVGNVAECIIFLFVFDYGWEVGNEWGGNVFFYC